MFNDKEKIKRKFIKGMKLDTIEETEDLINRFLKRMTYSQLLYTKERVFKKQQKEIGTSKEEANILFLALVDEEINKRESKQQ